MIVLVLNSGSSSLKYRVFRWPDQAEICRGAVEGVGGSTPRWTQTVAGQADETKPIVAPDHAAALDAACLALAESRQLPAEGPDLVAHRVVHGGDRFNAAAEIDEAIIAQIERLTPLAPLHNPANLLGIRLARKRFATARHAAVFDTAFHQTLSPQAWRYALPHDLADKHGVRRYGFHGTSHRWGAGRAAELLGRPVEELKTVVLHLGAGASAAAVDGGRSIDTSMGMTPLEGLVMATRCGDLDPGALLYLQREAGLSVEQADELLNRRSGLLGLCGDADLRRVLARAASGDALAATAIDTYTYRIAKQVGAYAVALGRLDAVVFTAGVGERSAEIRRRVVDRLSVFGAKLDAGLNEAPASDDRQIAAADSRVALLVVAANEEMQIAREAAALLA